jgi:hypothetical protein
MQTPHPRKLFLLAGVFLAALVAVIPASAQPNEALDASGISIAGPGPYLPNAPTTQLKRALNDAWLIARDNPDDFGYPWLDAQGVVVQRVTTAKGRGLADKLRIGVPHRTEHASRSYSELEAIKDEVVELRKAGVPGADQIWMTMPDELNNRIIVWVDHLHNGLMGELARTYGTHAIAVRIEKSPNPRAARYTDAHPYTGGAAYDPSNSGRCTYAFSFTHGFVTAGHCETKGGVAKTWSGTQLGTIGDDINWVNGVGTVPFPGGSADQGDIAFITTPSSTQLRPRIYNGSSSSSAATTNVESMAFSESSLDDKICMSGSTTGESCGWKVYGRNANVDYGDDGIVHGVTATTQSRIDKPYYGDSGGPVYVYNPDGSVVAKGVFSGFGHYPLSSWMFFTEIVKAWTRFPGSVKTGGKVSFLIGRQSNKCMDVQGGSTANGADAILYSCSGATNQQWYWESVGNYSTERRIVSANGKCLSIDSNLSTNGAWVHQWTCFYDTYNPGQLWELMPDGRIVNGYGKCLSVAYNATTNSSKLNQWDCIGAPSQYWTWSN